MEKTSDTRLIAASDLLVAGALLSRVPLPHASEAAFARQARAGWAYPVIGVLLALLSGVVWWGAGWLGLPVMVQAGLSLAALTMMSGALHEDGLADTADGLWGGYDRARRLEIMKDSRIGSYGVLALVFGTGLRWIALAAAGPVALLVAASLSRSVLPGLLRLLPMARGTGMAHSVGRPAFESAALALGVGGVLAVLVAGFGAALLALALAVAVAAAVGALAQRKIGGVTGDICGAVQQLAELAILLALIGL